MLLLLLLVHRRAHRMVRLLVAVHRSIVHRRICVLLLLLLVVVHLVVVVRHVRELALCLSLGVLSLVCLWVLRLVRGRSVSVTPLNVLDELFLGEDGSDAIEVLPVLRGTLLEESRQLDECALDLQVEVVLRTG